MSKDWTKMAGMTMAEFNAGLNKVNLPDHEKQAMAEKEKELKEITEQSPDSNITWALATVLQRAEIARANKTDGLILWPMQWSGGVCTGVPLDLYRSAKKEKMNMATHEVEPNENYGRFYFATRVPVMHGGQPVLNQAGYPETRLDCFTWFDQSRYVRSGAFHRVAGPRLVHLMLHSKGEWAHDPGNDYWPKDLQAIIKSTTFRA